MTRAAQCIAGIVAATLSAGGCSLNSSPLHTELSAPEFDRVVREHFKPGMPGVDADRLLSRWGVAHRAARMPVWLSEVKNAQGLEADIRAPGVNSEWAYWKWDWGRLYLWFDSSDRLAQIAYSPPDARRPDHPRPTHVIALDGAAP